MRSGPRRGATKVSLTSASSPIDTRASLGEISRNSKPVGASLGRLDDREGNIFRRAAQRRGARDGGPSVLKLEEVPTPEPGQNQVLVRIHAVGINPVDTYLRSNTDNRGPKLPYTPGSDAAGVVEAVGSGVTQVKAGDRVYVGGTLPGAYAEFCLCGSGQLHPLPANATFAQGAAMNVPYATAYQALFHRAHGQAGETFLVHGASGGVGMGGTLEWHGAKQACQHRPSNADCLRPSNGNWLLTKHANGHIALQHGLGLKDDKGVANDKGVVKFRKVEIRPL
jgi:Alcohol dehydrogenase GroES-like domain